MHELEQWDFLDGPLRQKLRDVYQARQFRLAELSSQKTWVEWPVSDWEGVATLAAAETPRESNEPVPQQSPVTAEETDAEPEAQSEPGSQSDNNTESQVEPELQCETQTESENELEPEEPAPLPEYQAEDFTPTYQAPEKSLVASLVGEADIRWFHSLGALLVVAAVVGWLRASWDSYGRVLAGLLIASSPIILHFVARKLKESVPLSARLLAILANILTPPALLALDVFGALPDFVPGKLYWTCAMLVSAALLSWQAEQTHEKVPLYVGALCAVMAGWSQGALTTALCSLAVGFLFAWDTESDEPEWAKLRKSVSFYAGSFGAVTTLALFDTTNNPFLPLTAFTAALVFLHLPTLSGQTQSSSGSRIFMQTSLTLIGSILMRAVLEVPAGGVALYLVFASALFLTAKPDSELAATGAKIASGLGAFALAMGFLSDLPSVLGSQQSLQQAALRFLFTAVGTGFFWMTSRRNREDQGLFLLGLMSLLGGWLHLLLYAITRQEITQIDQFIPLMAGIPIFAGILLVSSRFMRSKEQETLGSFLFPVVGASMVITACTRLLGTEGATGWELVLAFHALLTLAWERKWLADTTNLPALALEGLPRLTVGGVAAVALALLEISTPERLLVVTTALIVASFVVKATYQKSSFEFAWVGLWTSLSFSEPYYLLAGSLLSFALSLVSSPRRQVSLVASTAFSVAVFVVAGLDVHFTLLFLPPLAFALSLLLPTLDGRSTVSQNVRRGFEVLLAAAVVLGDVPPSWSLVYCLTLAALASGFALFWAKKQDVAEKVISRYSGPVLFGMTLLWSLDSTTLETGILLLLASLGTFFLLKSDHRLEAANALALFGAAQLATDTHFILDPVVLGVGVVISEIATLVTRKPSPQISNLALLVVASVQGQTSVWAGHEAEVLLVASLLLALRLVQQDLYSSAMAATALFLWKVDPLLADGVDFKIRVLPTALVLIGCALWKWNREFTWTRPALRIGLGLMVAPACLQFLVGQDLYQNFAWMLAFGSSYLVLSFISPQTLKRDLRQAGGYTLTAWAVVSLTRVALELPWQAATLLVGVALVTVGVVVERRNRNAASKRAES